MMNGTALNHRLTAEPSISAHLQTSLPLEKVDARITSGAIQA